MYKQAFSLILVTIFTAACHSSDDSSSSNIKEVFVTQASITGDITGGDFTNYPQGMVWEATICADLTAIECANLYCQREAEYRNYSTSPANLFSAWLSDSTVNAKDNIRYSSDNQYVRAIDNSVVIAQPGSLIVSSGQPVNLSNAVNNTDYSVWTGTGINGTISLDVAGCNNWTESSSATNNIQGQSNADNDAWTLVSTAGSTCSSSARIYCFER